MTGHRPIDLEYLKSALVKKMTQSRTSESPEMFGRIYAGHALSDRVAKGNNGWHARVRLTYHLKIERNYHGMAELFF